MYKLLPIEEKAQVAREYASRRFAVLLWTLALVLILGIGGLLPSYILSDARHEDALVELNALNESEAGEYGSIEEWVANTRMHLVLFNPELNTDNLYKNYSALLTELPAGVQVDSLLWKKDGEKVVITVAGQARDRQALLEFEKRLNESGVFKDTSLPLSNLAQGKDLHFELKVSPK